LETSTPLRPVNTIAKRISSEEQREERRELARGRVPSRGVNSEVRLP
jgi:hypothetical protein